VNEPFPQLPADWRLSRVDRVASVNARIGWKALTAAEYQVEGYIFLSTPNIKNNQIDFENVNYISQYRYDESPELKLAIDDVLLVKDGNTLGITNLVRRLPSPATVNGSIAVLRPFGIDSRFLQYVLDSNPIQGRINAIKGGMGVPHLFQWDIKRLPVPLPSLDEQRRIAQFLDAETARIDTLIAKKKRMAELAEARFLASLRWTLLDGRPVGDPLNVRPDEVTDTLNTTARLSWRFRFGSGTTPQSDNSRYYDAGGMPWVLTGDLQDSPIQSVGRGVTLDALDQYSALTLHPAGSLVVAMYGATIGRMGLLKHTSAVNQACCVLTPRGQDLPSFVFYWLLGFRDQLVERGRGAGQPNISQELLKSIRIPFPEPDVQHKIVSRLDAERSRIVELIRSLELQIVLLSERRKALITAAVTGELDIPARHATYQQRR